MRFTHLDSEIFAGVNRAHVRYDGEDALGCALDLEVEADSVLADILDHDGFGDTVHNSDLSTEWVRKLIKSHHYIP